MQSPKINEIFAYFSHLFGGNPKCELDFESDIECLVAIILSAQCTDKRVNIVTKTLFKKYKTVNDFAVADQKILENEIYSTGFYHNKARNIINMAQAVVNHYDGIIPNNIESLTKLPGVGRKTASVFLTEWHKLPALPVDTHVTRIANRLALTKSVNPVQIEKDLITQLDKENWCTYSLLMVLFGRYHCTAINPKCETCKIKSFCVKHK